MVPGNRMPLRMSPLSIVSFAIARIVTTISSLNFRRDVADEPESAPSVSEHSGGDRSARHAGDTRQSGQAGQFVEPPQRTDVKQHGAIAAARETQSNTGAQRSWCVRRNGA